MDQIDKTKSTCTNFDKIGVPVTWTYKRDQTFNTPVGGCFSCLATIIVLVYVACEMYTLVEKPQYSVE